MFYVYSCGSNGRFQLGDGSDEDLNQLKRVFESTVRPVKVVCGGNHTLILLENGDLYAAGDDTFGQCGIDPETIGNNEQRVKAFSRVPRVDNSPWLDCSAGYEYSIFVNGNQQLFSVGFGLKGELGLGEKVGRSTKLTKIDTNFESNIVEVKSCLDHTVILLENHEVYGWGNGRSGKLGEPAQAKIWKPRLIETGSITHIEVGRDFTALGDTEGKIEILGKDKFNIASKLPQSWKLFKAMWSSLHLIDESNHIISAGNDSHGQLIPVEDVKFSHFDVGSEHGIITDGQKVKSWGWGEHGNCGINKIDSVTFNYINDLHQFPDTERIIAIKGGCATTWVVTEFLDSTKANE